MYKTAARRRHNNHHHHNNFDLAADLEKIKSAFSDTAQDVRGKAADMIYQSVDDIKDKTTRMRDNVATYAADRPFKSLGAALLIGVAIGYLLKK